MASDQIASADGIGEVRQRKENERLKRRPDERHRAFANVHVRRKLLLDSPLLAPVVKEFSLPPPHQ